MSINIKIRDNGPYVIEGDFTLTDAQGNPVPIVKRALCRCGGSTMKPFCDGTHSKIGFQGAIAAVQESEPSSS
ncbi:MAG TPA: CDGSH iron-sulfur domain-containing protein [Thermoanaerobaculia bacterium]|nr:CDGSH iron-sulfur domain-containing protein [Thermoanaerobaculia bacterium]